MTRISYKQNLKWEGHFKCYEVVCAIKETSFLFPKGNGVWMDGTGFSVFIIKQLQNRKWTKRLSHSLISCGQRCTFLLLQVLLLQVFCILMASGNLLNSNRIFSRLNQIKHTHFVSKETFEIFVFLYFSDKFDFD